MDAEIPGVSTKINSPATKSSTPNPSYKSRRKSRNESEKRRRDTFNRLIADLAMLVADGDQKMDKSNVLKCAITFLEKHQARAESSGDEAFCGVLDDNLRKLTGFNLSDVVQLYMDSLSASVFCVSCTGHVQHASTSFAKHFDLTVSQLTESNLFDVLSEQSVKELTEVFDDFKIVPDSSRSNTDDRVASLAEPICKMISSKQSKRELELRGYLRKVSRQTSDRHLDDVNPPDIDIPIESEGSHFIGIAVPLNDWLSPEIWSDSLGSINRKYATFTIVYNFDFVCVQIDGFDWELLGYSRLELLGTNGYNYVHSDDLHALSESHRKCMFYITKTVLKADGASGQLCAHRLLTKGRKWLWVDCFAFTDCTSTVNRLCCRYTPISQRTIPDTEHQHGIQQGELIQNALNIDVSNFQKSCSTQSPTFPPDCFATTSTPEMKERLLNTSTQLSSSVSARSSISLSMSLPTSTSVYSPTQSRNLITPKSSCSARIVIEPLPPKRVKKGQQQHQTSGSTEVSVEQICSPSTSGAVSPYSPFSPLSTTSSPKRRSHSSLAFIEHCPLPEHRFVQSFRTDETPTQTGTDDRCGSVALSISPMYRHVWEELQRQSEILRQQVLQKELELRELHLQKVFSSIGDTNE